MDSNNIAKLGIALIFPIVFNLLFFLLADIANMNATQWVSYAFLHIAYLSLFIPSLLNKNSTDDKSITWAPVGIATFYFCLEFVVAIIFLFFLKSESLYATSLIIQVVLFAIFLATILTAFLINNNTNRHLNEMRQRRQQLQRQQQDNQR